MATRSNKLLLLVLLSLALSSSYSANHLMGGNGTTQLRPRILNAEGLDTDEDYTNVNDDVDVPPQSPTVRSQKINPEVCNYDPCRDQQIPCVELAKRNHCRCPGLSGPREVPEAPFLEEVSQKGSDVVVQWCAPSSTVLHYEVVVDSDVPQVFGALSRKAVLKDLEAGVRVCVKAVNTAGASSPNEVSCRRYEPQSNTSLALKAGLIGAGLGLLLLLSLVILLLWRRKACGKSGGGGSSPPAEGLPL